MALAESAEPFTETIDPSDLVPFFLSLAPMIPEGAAITALAIAPALESAAIGLEIAEGDRAAFQPDGESLIFWPQIDAAYRTLADWQGAGKMVGVEVTITTDTDPPEQIQRSVKIKVVER